ncbi:TPA: hypothetical protein ACH3X2_013000 [Trebouxia sp. C0005]
MTTTLIEYVTKGLNNLEFHTQPWLQFLSFSSVSTLLILSCIPPLHVPVRNLLRPTVVYHVERGLLRVHQAQRFENWLLTILFDLSSRTVSVPFYVTFLPSLIWSGEAELGTRLALLMGLCLYVGNAMKDLISAPRPFGSEYKGNKVRLIGGSELEANVNAQEYGLPSSHTMNSLCLNFFVVHYLLDKHLVPSEWALAMYLGTAVWVAWIGLARVYMGLHTPIDIGAGALLGTLVLVFYLAVDEKYEGWILSDRLAILWQALASIVFLRLHPKPLRHTPSYEFTTSFGGVCWGLVVGMSRQHLIYRQNHPGQFVRIVQSRAGVIALLQRVTLGFVLVVVMKPLSKQVVVIFLPLVYKLVPVDLRKLWQPPLHSLKPPKHEGIPVDENGQSWDVSVTARFISYASIGWTVVDLAPLMFQMLGFSIPWGLS